MEHLRFPKAAIRSATARAGVNDSPEGTARLLKWENGGTIFE